MLTKEKLAQLIADLESETHLYGSDRLRWILDRLIDYQIENGTDAIVVCGTTGEASTLSHEEHVECIRYVTK